MLYKSKRNTRNQQHCSNKEYNKHYWHIYNVSKIFAFLHRYNAVFNNGNPFHCKQIVDNKEEYHKETRKTY